VIPKDMLTDVVTVIRQNGERIEDVACRLRPDKMTTGEATFAMEEGDFIERRLPTGITERYLVLDAGYRTAPIRGVFPPHYQSRIEKTTKIPPTSVGRSVFNISGPGARVNIGTVDNSNNVVNVTTSELFAELRSALEVEEGITPEVLDRLDELESAQGTPEVLSAYQRFMAVAANHAAVLGSFLPALAQMLG